MLGIKEMFFYRANMATRTMMRKEREKEKLFFRLCALLQARDSRNVETEDNQMNGNDFKSLGMLECVFKVYSVWDDS